MSKHDLLCRVYWGSHGCKKPRGTHEDRHVCTCGHHLPVDVTPFGEDVGLETHPAGCLCDSHVDDTGHSIKHA